MRIPVKGVVAAGCCLLAAMCGCEEEKVVPGAAAFASDEARGDAHKVPTESVEPPLTEPPLSTVELKEAGRRARVEVEYLRRILRDDGRDAKTGAQSLQTGLPCRLRESEDRVPGGDLLVVDKAAWFNAVIDAGLCVYGCAVCGAEPEGSALTLEEECPRARESLAKAEGELAKAGF